MTDREFHLPLHGMAEALHIGEEDLPFVQLNSESLIQLLHVDLAAGLWVVRGRFPPGFETATHYHTGSVMAVTLTGSWWYIEYPDAVNSAGSYLFEPAHSVHTLKIGPEGADIWFAINGANVDVDGDGKVISVLDARSILAAYQDACTSAGLDASNVLIKT